MLSVPTVLESLHGCLANELPPSLSTRIFDIPVAPNDANDAFDLQQWCSYQPQWPQFYWQQRNGDEELAALGAVKTFSSPRRGHCQRFRSATRVAGNRK